MMIILKSTLFLGLALCQITPVFAAKSKKDALLPTTAEKINQVTTDYAACRKAALKKYKKHQRGSVKKELKSCDTRFPTAALFKDCKSSALQRFRNNKTSAENALKYCELILAASTYDPAELVPANLVAGKVFYAGIDLEEPLVFKDQAVPNFDCSRLQETFDGFHPPEFVLFGNRPSLFAPLANLSKKELSQALEGKRFKGKDPYFRVADFGRIYGLGENEEKIVFFPAASCSFNGDPGQNFQDHKIYYLVDEKEKSLAPYFGISFFKPLADNLDSANLVEKLRKRLGPKFKITKKKNTAFFVSEFPLGDFDSEGDPQNLCKTPRSHRRIGVVKNRDNDPTKPEYVLVANIKNVCEFGDKLAERLR